jgi:pilus assembly protein CpaB
MALWSMERNEEVLRNKITAPGRRGSLSTLIDGKPGFSVAVENVHGMGDFIQSNDRVDVVLICNEELILQKMKVFASEQITGQQGEQPSVVVEAVTLETVPKDAKTLVLATNIGRLSLILRQPIEEAGDGRVRRITEKDLCVVPEKAKVAPPPPPPPASKPTITYNRGGKLEERLVNRYLPP